MLYCQNMTSHCIKLLSMMPSHCMRNGWTPTNMPPTCFCGKRFSVEHALSCSRGGFPSVRHNEIRDIAATLCTEVCNDFCMESDLQPLMSDQLRGSSANQQDDARLDISATGVWGGRFKKSYFDVRVLNPLAPTNRNWGSSCMHKLMSEKRIEWMSSEWEKLSPLPSLHLSSQPLEV